MTIAGFLTYHLHCLDEATNTDSDPEVPNHSKLQLLLGGYSYGSLIIARLPPTAEIINRFQQASLGTAAAEVVMRARTLAKQILQSARESYDSSKLTGRGLRPGHTALGSTAPHSMSSPITVGGEETDPSERRRSRDSYHSVDFVRKSVEMPARIARHMRMGREESNLIKEFPNREIRTPSDDTSVHAPKVDVCYLLISPVLLPFSNQLLPPGPPMPPFGLYKREAEGSPGGLFKQTPTLAVFGTKDGFTSSRRLRAWAEKLRIESANSTFTWRQIEGAGHFWREEGVMKVLQDQIIAWISKLVSS